ncbi:MAG: hypothetical protein Q7S27_02885 [Nanoarchaeota archaeon]|nr:hypothetical protein [Nanoarchaeota archaeon]
MKRERSNAIRLIFTLTLLLIFIAIIANLAAAQGSKLLCLTKGQTVKFSQCNPNMEDKKCVTSSCQLCVNEIRSGVYCPQNINECDSACEKFEEPIQTSDENLPKITLSNPINNLILDKPSKIDFSFTVTQAFSINKCSLLINGNSTISTQARIQSKSIILSHTLNEGGYSWNIECTTRDGKNIIKSVSRTLIISPANEQNNTQFSEINLLSPTDNFTSPSKNLVFNYTLPQLISAYSSCNLIVDNNTVLTSANLSETIFSYSPGAGTHSWLITCNKIDNSNISSQLRTMTISVPQNDNQNDNQNNGGGGGGSITINSIVDNKKAQSKNSTNVSSLPIEELSQTSEDEDEEILPEEEPIEKKSEKTFKSAITGAVTGAVSAVKNNKMTAIIFVVVILAFFMMINLSRKKKENKNINTMIKSLVTIP